VDQAEIIVISFIWLHRLCNVYELVAHKSFPVPVVEITWKD